MFFQSTEEAPPDPIFGLLGKFRSDIRKEKVNLMVGIYKDEELKAEVIPSIRMAMRGIANEGLMADYLPIDGFAELIELLGPLAFGDKAWGKSGSRIVGAHTAGGTGALRVGAEFLAQEVGTSVYLPNHTWPTHRSIFMRVGYQVENYPYYSKEKRGFDCEALLSHLRKLPEKSIVVLHACCHNPTGSDPSPEEWRSISQVIQEKRLFPFFDFAYQGLGEGLEKDATPIQIFLEEGHEMLIAYSCSKNFSMYCHRVGALFAVGDAPAFKVKVGSQMRKIIRALYSNPPAYGAWLVTEVLKRDDLKKIWKIDLGNMRHRIQSTRELFIEKLNAGGQSFNYLKGHKGMFSFIDMQKEAVHRLMEQYAIYMTDNGRVNIAGLSAKNIDYVVESILAVCGKT